MILAARQVVKDYPQGDGMQRVLDHVSLDVGAGRFVAIMGPSGSGKSTLLHLLGGLDTPDAGEIELDGTNLSSLSDDARTRLRRHRIGIVYQFFNLVPVLTVAENIALPAVIAGRPAVTYRSTLDDVIELVGLGPHRDKQPSQLSGGQQQRAAIARALFTSPAVLLADEPTGNLDLASGAEVLGLFLAAQRAMGQTIVMVTHDPRSAGYAQDVHLLRDGSVRGQLDVASRCHGDARTDPTHEERSRVVLRWLEELDLAGMGGPARRAPMRAAEP
ncbi:MAG: ABC transporter ATP-binding protein [Acidimicrobiales bacterium]